jgi:hypothetical protein
MARHIYIGTESGSPASGGSALYTSGLLNAGIIDVQKVSNISGPTSMSPGDLRTNTEQFRIVQGTGSVNIVSPWIYGADVINWDGQTYAAPTSHKHTVTLGGTSTAAGTLSIKLVRTDVPGFDSFSFDTDVPTGTAATAVDALVTAAFAAANVPSWLDAVCANTGTANVFEGSIAGNTNDDGTIWDENPSTFVVSCTDVPAGITATWTTTTPTASADAGAGNGYLVRKIEEQWWGNQFGYYDRVQLPKPPTNYSVLASNYDMYSIAATKDGSSQSQVHGVDNTMVISIAIVDGQGTGLEARLNPYLADCGFANVTI